MRDLKFRCWNAFANTMQSWDDMVKLNKIHLIANQQGSYPVMQFIGLKDVKGVDVYESDIVTCDDFDGFVTTTSLTGRVTFIGGSFGVTDEGGRFNNLALTCAPNVYVIGNIHQNPELLASK